MTGAEMIAAERKRQIEVEGWDAKHDDGHSHGGLSEAAICYAANRIAEGGPFEGRIRVGAPDICTAYAKPVWPWSPESDKREKHDRIRSLTIAGALIAAEIDRLQRLGKASDSDFSPFPEPR